MDSRGTAATDMITDALERISQSDGFHTDAGARVHRGNRPAHISEEDADQFPLILVRCDAERPGSVQPRRVMLDRSMTVQGQIISRPADYEPDMDALAEDIAKALLPLTVTNDLPSQVTQVVVTGGDYIHPEPGSDLAGVSYTVTVSHVLTIEKED